LKTEADVAEPETSKATGGIPYIAVLIVTLIGAGAGGYFGSQVAGLIGHDDAQKEKQEHAKAANPASKLTIRMLQPITTNLANPTTTWIRLEAAALIKQDLGTESDLILTKLTEDITAFMRTVPLAQIEGPSGFQNLREDLNDRVRVRSQGKVTELLIQALVVE
jgi:flagellar protein FliL